MRWGKVILSFQAIATLIIGIFFFVQVFNIEYNYEQEIIQDSKNYDIGEKIVAEQLAKYDVFKKRFFSASYVLVIVSIIEIVLIWRLFDQKPVYSQEFNFNSQFSFVK